MTFPLTFPLPFSLILWFFIRESFGLSWDKEASLVYPQIINCCSHLTYTQTASTVITENVLHIRHGGEGAIHHPEGPGIREGMDASAGPGF